MELKKEWNVTLKPSGERLWAENLPSLCRAIQNLGLRNGAICHQSKVYDLKWFPPQTISVAEMIALVERDSSFVMG